MPPRAKKCSFRQGSRRCPFDGTGDPALCDAHRIAIAEAARPKRPAEVVSEALRNFMSGRPVDIESAFRSAEAILWEIQANGNVWNSRRGPAGAEPPPPVDHDAEALKAKRARARKILGIKPDVHLTAEMVKERKKTLAKKYHPDRPGGSAEKMALINDAADVLMASL